jgi:hypothetical protein
MRPKMAGILRRKCACGGTAGPTSECDECRKKRLGLQRRHVGDSEPSAVPPVVHEVLRSRGEPLDPKTRSFMESCFGHDFSQVRVHHDARAAESARSVGALAYTVGRDVVFGSGQYSPGNHGGKRLIAHELTHVVQQHSNFSRPRLHRAEANSAPAEPGSQSQPSDTSSKMRSLIAEIGRALALANRYLDFMPEPAPDKREQLDVMIDRFRALDQIAQGKNEALKLQILTAFSPERMTQLQAQLALQMPAQERVPVQERSSGAIAAMTLQVSNPEDPAEREAHRIANMIVSGVERIPGSLSSSNAVLNRQPATPLPPAPVPAPPPPLTLVPAPPPPVPTPWWAPLLEGLGGALLVILSLGMLFPSDSPVPRAQPQPQPRSKREDCERSNFTGLPCEEGVEDLEEVAIDFLIRKGFKFSDLLDCSRMSRFGAAMIDECSGAPGESWHCRVKGTDKEVSVFGCVCCHEDGTSGLRWEGAHWSGKP